MKFTFILHQSTKRQYDNFIDKLRLYVKGGSSGRGLSSKNGIGGTGGNVYIVASPDKSHTLESIKSTYPNKRFIAQHGQDSNLRFHYGQPGQNIYVPVPCGIVIRDAESNQIIGTIDQEGDKVLVAKGVSGGNRYTGYKAKKAKGKSIYLDMQTIADVGFVGFPNAGKSTLLNSLSAASPEVADYPFTTLRPYLGLAEFEDRRIITLADMPGLIEGSSLNEGMGHNFLKHIERTKVLLFIVDIFGFTMYKKESLRSPLQTVQLLIKELELYNPNFLRRPAILALNKIDLPESEEKYKLALEEILNWRQELEKSGQQKTLKFSHILPISAKKNLGLQELKLSLRKIIDNIIIKEERALEGGSFYFPNLARGYSEERYKLR